MKEELNKTKEEILKVSNRLFITKGFDKTSISDILKEVGIARGTLYYYFQSKEEIMDSIIDLHSKKMLESAKEIAEDKNIPVLERLFLVLNSLNLKSQDDIGIIDFIHKPQNALINEKNNKIIVSEVPPILMIIVEEGIKEGIFKVDYLYEVLEMIVIYGNTIFTNEFHFISKEKQKEKISAFIKIMENLLGAKEGSFEPIINMLLKS